MVQRVYLRTRCSEAEQKQYSSDNLRGRQWKANVRGLRRLEQAVDLEVSQARRTPHAVLSCVDFVFPLPKATVAYEICSASYSTAQPALSQWLL